MTADVTTAVTRTRSHGGGDGVRPVVYVSSVSRAHGSRARGRERLGPGAPSVVLTLGLRALTLTKCLFGTLVFVNV